MKFSSLDHVLPNLGYLLTFQVSCARKRLAISLLLRGSSLRQTAAEGELGAEVAQQVVPALPGPDGAELREQPARGLEEIGVPGAGRSSGRKRRGSIGNPSIPLELHGLAKWNFELNRSSEREVSSSSYRFTVSNEVRKIADE